MSAAEYELTYFPVRGRGMAIIYFFKDQGLTYEYKSDLLNIWPEIKAKTPFGQIPLLREGDFELAQSGAIMRYLGSKHGLDGKSPKERALADMIYEQQADVRNSYVNVIYGDYENGKGPYITKLPELLAPLEKILKQNNGGNGFFVGDSIKYVDYSIFDLLDDLLILAPQCLDGLPTLKAFHARIADRPILKAFRATEAFQTTRVNGNGKQ